MTDQHAAPHSDDRQPATEDLILELNFVPDWARRPADQTPVEPTRERPAPRHERRGDRSHRPDRARRDRQQRGGPPRGGGRHDRGTPRDRRDGPARRPERRPPVAPAPITIRLLPEQHNLATIVRKVSTSRRAYPLVNIAYLFLDNPKACDVRIEPDHGQKGAPLFQCKACKAVFLEQTSLHTHIVGAHLEDYFVGEEIEVDPPSGQFPCVCRCGLSGELLGPPNHHTYAARVQEMHSTRFSNMSMERYREKIEVSRDPEVVEQWKREACKQHRYRLKQETDEDSEPLVQADAEAHMRDKVVPRLSRKTHRAVLPLEIARESPDEGIRRAVFEAVAKETRFPMSLLFAMRSAFRHMHLHVFKTGGQNGAHFVCAKKPAPLDPGHVVEAIRSVICHLHDHPGCTRSQLIEALCPGADKDSESAHEILSHLSWLIDKGHVLEFFNGTLSVPLVGRQS